MMTAKELKRFVVKVARPNGEGGCHEWMASKNKDGYGTFDIAGKMKKAHRLSFEHFVGPIPDGICVLHKCDNPACVKPDHLFAGTVQQNMDDMVAKGRAARGCNSGRAKLTEANVRTIKARYLDGQMQTEIALEMGVHQTQISNILSGKSWKHVF